MMSCPEWLEDLVIYEIAPKGFTSPNGPQSGTFESLKVRLPYLQDLGITGIWLAGHSLSDARHFYNVWAQYGVIEPEQLDPSLGGPEQFKSLIDEAHRCGIRVFLDVIMHGVMRTSSLVERHPHWFRGGSWGMVDYEWQGGHTDLDDWWVQLWTGYVTQYGVDGFRVDIEICRPDLWSRIRQNAAHAGHPIIIFGELTPVIPGVTDFTQMGNVISHDPKDEINPIVDDIPGLYERGFPAAGEYKVAIRLVDDTVVEASTLSDGMPRVKLVGFTANRIHHQPELPAGESELHLTVHGIAYSAVKSVVVTRLDESGPAAPRRWIFRQWAFGPFDESPVEDAAPLKMEGSAPEDAPIDLYLQRFHSYSPSVQLSSHDHGWMNFPADKNPYVAKGRRAVFGYALLFTPMIPIFVAGEEFDAQFHPAPTLSTGLFGGANPGQGRLLYGQQLDWSELEQPRHRAMLEDVKRMLGIRRREWAVLAPEVRGEIRPLLSAIEYRSDIRVPVPYMRWSRHTGIVIAANHNQQQDAHLELRIPVEKLQAPPGSRFNLQDLWNDEDMGCYSPEQLTTLTVTIPRDNTPRGGLMILKVEATAGA